MFRFGRNWNWELENHFLSLALFLPPLLHTCFIASSLVCSDVYIHDGIWLPYRISQAERCLSLNAHSTFLIEKIWLTASDIHLFWAQPTFSKEAELHQKRKVIKELPLLVEWMILVLSYSHRLTTTDSGYSNYYTGKSKVPLQLRPYDYSSLKRN